MAVYPPTVKRSSRQWPKVVCRIVGCGTTRKIRNGLCQMHYARNLRNGDPLAGRVSPGMKLGWLRAYAGFVGKDCLMWPFKYGSVGYGRLHIEGKEVIASRVMCALAHGPAPSSRHQAAHNCGDSHCLNPSHLRWATGSENNMDKILHGTAQRGLKHGMVKLTPSNVREIRTLGARMFHRDVAAIFGISRPTVTAIVRRRLWRWLKD